MFNKTKVQIKCSSLIFILLIFTFASELFSVDRTIGVVKNDMTGWEGYNLFAPLNSGKTYLIDNYGRIVNTWQSQYIPNLGVYLLENGNLVRPYDNGSSVYGVEIYTWDGTLIWQYAYTNTLYYQHHDVEPLPNGNILMVSYDIRLKSYMVSAGRDPASFLTPRIFSEKIVEVQPTGLNTGIIVWEWKVTDHLIQEFDSSKLNYGVVKDHPERIDVNFHPNSGRDWLHVNSVDYNSEFDQILISACDMSEFWIVDHSTTTAQAASHSGGNYGKGGDILYRWGNPKSYQATTNNEQKIFGQHDVRWVENGYPGEGNITIFNNGLGRPAGEYSTVDEIVLPMNVDGSYNTPVPGNSYYPINQIWVYTANPRGELYSPHISGAHRLPNGNTLICEGFDSYFWEVQPDSTIVWKYISPEKASGGSNNQGDAPSSAGSFRCSRYNLDYPAFSGRNITPKGYIEINPISVQSTQNSPKNPYDFNQVTVTSKIFDSSGINSADLYVYFGSDSLIISMKDDGLDQDIAAGDSVYTAVIPALTGYQKANYFIKITDGSMTVFNDPPFASKNYYFTYNISAGTPVNVAITENTDSILINWDPVPGINTYKVFSSDDPYNEFAEDTTGTFSGESWTTSIIYSKKFYYVVAYKN